MACLVMTRSRYYALGILSFCRAQRGCEAKIRGIAKPLAFCMQHSLDIVEELGNTTAASAAKVCCSVFGRDEGGSEFTFTQQHIDLMIEGWSQNVRAVGYKVTTNPTADTIFAAELCVSDKNKPLLLANEAFVPYLVDALLLDPGHPRAKMREDLKAWCQTHHAEALAQLAMYEPSRKALLQDGSGVVAALDAVAKAGLSEHAREQAEAALTALRGVNKSAEVVNTASEGQKHVMLSCECMPILAP